MPPKEAKLDLFRLGPQGNGHQSQLMLQNSAQFNKQEKGQLRSQQGNIAKLEANQAEVADEYANFRVLLEDTLRAALDEMFAIRELAARLGATRGTARPAAAVWVEL